MTPPDTAGSAGLEVAIPSADEARFEYSFITAPWTVERHEWSILTEIGAVAIWAETSGTSTLGSKWFGGIECHYAEPPEYMEADKPSQEHCGLLGKPCWHDGSSLQFSEEVAPMLPDPVGAPMAGRFCELLKPILRHRYKAWLEAAALSRAGKSS